MRLLLLICILNSCVVSSTAQEFFVERLPDFINSEYDEIIPVPSRDGQTLYFTRVAYPDFERTLMLDSIDLSEKYSKEKFEQRLAKIYSQIEGRTIRNAISSRLNQDVWMAKGDTSGFQSIEHPGFPLNNALPNSLVSITPDPNAFYIINQFKENGDLAKGFSVIRRGADGEWIFPEPIEIGDYYTIKSDVNLTLSFDGEVLILSAERDDSKDLDLYVCFPEGENKWSSPIHMGNKINTRRREMTPFLSEDHITLFFASDRYNSSGGLDIFMTRRQDDTWTNWSTPVRMSTPINSNADESQPYFNMTSGFLYFTTKRDGSSDIYRVRIAPPQPTELWIRGRIINSETGQLVKGAMVRYAGKNTGENFVTSEDGYYKLKIPKGVAFDLIPEKMGFAGQTGKAFFRRDYYYFKEYYTVDIYLDPLSAGSKIRLQPIYFQQSKATILERSHAELERLAALLNENNSIHILVEGHTDNIGKPEDLMRLSRERADAVKQFLISQGVSSTRIETKGFGPSVPISDNTSEELRQQNRRVEVKITRID